jgi:hypothetical protein
MKKPTRRRPSVISQLTKEEREQIAAQVHTLAHMAHLQGIRATKESKSALFWKLALERIKRRAEK